MDLADGNQVQTDLTSPEIGGTSRDHPMWAPYLRLKNSKRTSKCQSFGELGTFYEKLNVL